MEAGFNHESIYGQVSEPFFFFFLLVWFKAWRELRIHVISWLSGSDWQETSVLIKIWWSGYHYSIFCSIATSVKIDPAVKLGKKLE